MCILAIEIWLFLFITHFLPYFFPLLIHLEETLKITKQLSLTRRL